MARQISKCIGLVVGGSSNIATSYFKTDNGKMCV